MKGTSNRRALIAGAGVAAFILAADVVRGIWNYLFSTAVFAQDGDEVSNFHALTAAFVLGLLAVVFAAAIFGAGVFVSLRWIAPVLATDGWGRVVLCAVIATAIGTAASLVIGILEALVGAFSAGMHPFGYAFTPSFNVSNARYGIVDAFGSAISPFVEWLPLVVLAVVLLRLWRVRASESAAEV